MPKREKKKQPEAAPEPQAQPEHVVSERALAALAWTYCAAELSHAQATDQAAEITKAWNGPPPGPWVAVGLQKGPNGPERVVARQLLTPQRDDVGAVVVYEAADVLVGYRNKTYILGPRTPFITAATPPMPEPTTPEPKKDDGAPPAAASKAQDRDTQAKLDHLKKIETQAARVSALETKYDGLHSAATDAKKALDCGACHGTGRVVRCRDKACPTCAWRRPISPIVDDAGIMHG